jgi:hypothetical protein
LLGNIDAERASANRAGCLRKSSGETYAPAMTINAFVVAR